MYIGIYTVQLKGSTTSERTQDKGPNQCFRFAFRVEGEEMFPEVVLVISHLVNNSGTLAQGVSLLSISSPSNILRACPL